MKRSLIVLCIAAIIATSCNTAGILQSNTRQSVVSESSEVQTSVGEFNIEVTLDSLENSDTSGVEISSADLGTQILVGTSDPEGRYLPTVEVLLKDNEESLEVNALQVPTEHEWSAKYLGEVNTDGLVTSTLVTTTFDSVSDTLLEMEVEGEMTVILPVNHVFAESDIVTVFETPLPKVFFIAPGEHTGTAKTAKILGFTEVIRMALWTGKMLYESYQTLMGVTDAFNNVKVPNLVGDRVDDPLAEWKILSYRYGYRFMIEETICDDRRRLDRVVRQEPEEESTITFWKLAEEGINLYVCRTVVVTIPSVEGMTGPEAHDFIESLGLRVVNEYAEGDCRRKEGEGNFEARYTDPPEGSSVEAGTPIGLYVCWISSTPAQANTPEPTKVSVQPNTLITSNPQAWSPGIADLFPSNMILTSYEYPEEILLRRSNQGLTKGYVVAGDHEKDCETESWIAVHVLMELYETASDAEKEIQRSSQQLDGLQDTNIGVGNETRLFYSPNYVDEYCGPDKTWDDLLLIFRRNNAIAKIRVGSLQGTIDFNEILSLATSIAELIDANILASLER